MSATLPGPSGAAAARDRYDWARRALPCMRVDSLASFIELDAVHRGIACAGDETHRFRLASGQLIRCVELTSQPAITGQGIDPARVEEARDEVVDRMSHAERRGAPSLARLFGMDGSRDEQGRRRICPPGSIPRWTPPLRTFLGFRNLAELRAYYPGLRDLGPGSPLVATANLARYHSLAGLNNQDNLGQLVDMNPWTPAIQENGMAIGQIWSQRGSGADKQSVETGWQVVEKLYNDQLTHFFIYFTTHDYDPNFPEGYNGAGGFFVQVNPDAILGGVIPTSVPGDDTQLSWSFGTWLRGSGDSRGWWILLMEYPIGYYPISLFASTGLADKASNVVCGGEVIDDGDASPSTQMGSGVLPDILDPWTSFGKSAFMKRVQYIDTDGKITTPDMIGTSSTNPLVYLSVVAPSDDDTWKPGFFFGGPGPNPSSTS